ncbi:MAG TPA: branched-chain amino acid ABC transporter substrate-binding protein [Solirubrobacteraceae bacterium]|nr:branched-chain amino acid ABC transporter substrate-binding protein [Solirubrobacteraceae bacterium]
MRARWLCLAALAFAPAAAGCGGVGISAGASTLGNQLTIYSSLPLQGPSGENSQQIVAGEKLALAEAGGHVGSLKIAYASLDDSNSKTGQWDPGVTAANAKTAAQDSSTVAYLGDYNSAASAVSLPLINSAGILQVSPASPYVGLTSSLDAGQDEPNRFYPTGRRTFGRIMAGDRVQAGAQIQLMREQNVKRVYVLSDQSPFEAPLAGIVGGDAHAAGIEVTGQGSVDTIAGADFSGEIGKITDSDSDAVFFSGGTTPGTVKLWQQLHQADPKLLLLGSNTMVSDAFTAQIGTAGARTLLTTPVLAPGLYPAAAQRLFSDYRAHFGGHPGPYALYGYEAMSVVLQAIRDAGPHGNERQTVIDRFFAIRNRDSVLGRYSIQPNGDTSLSSYGVDRVVNGRPVFWRALNVR